MLHFFITHTPAGTKFSSLVFVENNSPGNRQDTVENLSIICFSSLNIFFHNWRHHHPDSRWNPDPETFIWFLWALITSQVTHGAKKSLDKLFKKNTWYVCKKHIYIPHKTFCNLQCKEKSISYIREISLASPGDAPKVLCWGGFQVEGFKTHLWTWKGKS